MGRSFVFLWVGCLYLYGVVSYSWCFLFFGKKLVCFIVGSFGGGRCFFYYIRFVVVVGVSFVEVVELFVIGVGLSWFWKCGCSVWLGIWCRIRIGMFYRLFELVFFCVLKINSWCSCDWLGVFLV